MKQLDSHMFTAKKKVIFLFAYFAFFVFNFLSIRWKFQANNVCVWRIKYQNGK